MKGFKLWNNTIGARLFILFFGFSLALLILLTSVYYNRATKQINGKVGDVAVRSTMQASAHLDLLLKGYNTLSKSIAGNPEIQRLASRVENNRALQMINERTLINALGAIFYSWDDVVGIHVISNSGAVYSYGSGMAQAVDMHYRARDWYFEIGGSSGETVWLGLQPQSVIDMNERKPVFAFGRQLYDLNRAKSAGIIVVEMNPRSVLNILGNLRLSEHSEQAIVAKSNTIVAHDEFGRLGTSLAIPEEALHGNSPVQSLSSDSDLIVASEMVQADWRLVSVIPKRDLTVELNETKQFFLLILSLVVVLSAALALFLSRAIATPLKKLISEMKRVEQGDFEASLEVKSFEEINVLVYVFTRMVQRVNGLIRRVAVVSESEKNAQLHSLQSQVNPHFLYNTLDMIYWMLDEKDQTQQGEIVHALSHMFRYSSNWDSAATVTLAEELEQIDRYLFIIKTRLDGNLRYETKIDPKWLKLRLPKMILQPIVENAVIHGLDRSMSEAVGTICLSTELAGGTLFIHAADNGAGIEAAQLRMLQLRLAQISEEERTRASSQEYMHPDEHADVSAAATDVDSDIGIGMGNVHRRLVLRYGSHYGLTIDSEAGKGTRVTLMVPAYIDQAPNTEEGREFP